MNLDYGLGIYDFLLFPFYLFIIYRIFKYLSFKYENNQKLLFYLKYFFWIKIFIIIIYSLLAQYVIGGDSLGLFYVQGKHFADLILQDNSKLNLLFTQGGSVVDEIGTDKGYLLIESNYLVVKICTVLCFVTFSKYLLINLCIGFLAFLGSWQLFLFFYTQYPKLHKGLAFACMGIPTVVFWSSSISKDTVCMAAIGFLTMGLFDVIVTKRKIVRNSLIVFVTLFIIYQIKPYIILSYLPFFLYFLLLTKLNKTENYLIRNILKLFIPLIFVGIIFYIFINSKELFKQYSSESILDKVAGQQNAFNSQAEDAGSSFSLGEFDGSLRGFFSMAPKALVATFFRPFIWESKKLITLLSSLESMALMFFTLFLFLKPRGFIIFFSSIFNDALIAYCIGFAIVFGIFVGISTFNFGSLVRYKIPCMPFFVCGLLIIYEKIKHYKINKKPSVMST